MSLKGTFFLLNIVNTISASNFYVICYGFISEKIKDPVELKKKVNKPREVCRYRVRPQYDNIEKNKRG